MSLQDRYAQAGVIGSASLAVILAMAGPGIARADQTELNADFEVPGAQPGLVPVECPEAGGDQEWYCHDENVGDPGARGRISVTTSLGAGSSARSLEVEAGHVGTYNHVIATWRLSNTQAETGVWRLETDVFVASADLAHWQTGPELSLQNTAEGDNHFWTAIGGLQYVMNTPGDFENGSWNLWTSECDPEDDPQCTDPPRWYDAASELGLTELPALQPDTWYHLVLEVDLDSKTYLDLSISGPNGDGNLIDVYLKGLPLGVEDKHWLNESFFVAVEATNRPLSDGTTGPTRINYDNVRLSLLDDPDQVPDGVLRIVGGTGVQGMSQDGIPAALARLADPYAMVRDGEGNLYVAERSGHRVRRIGADGRITTIVGTGVAGYSGDGGQATQAKLNGPHGLALDGGVLYVADTLNHRIRAVALTSGIITTVAGTGVQGYNSGNNSVTVASSTQLSWPWGLAADHLGHLFVADFGNCLVREIDLRGGPFAGGDAPLVITLGGKAPLTNSIQCGYTMGDEGKSAWGAYFGYPTGLAVAPVGSGLVRLYVVESQAQMVVRFDVNPTVYPITPPDLQALTLVRVAGSTPGYCGRSGDGGPATSARLCSPTDIALDNDGDLYLSDTYNHQIRHIDSLTGIIDLVAGDPAGPPVSPSQPSIGQNLLNPRGIFLDPDLGLFVADQGFDVVRLVQP